MTSLGFPFPPPTPPPLSAAEGPIKSAIKVPLSPLSLANMHIGVLLSVASLADLRPDFKNLAFIYCLAKFELNFFSLDFYIWPKMFEIYLLSPNLSLNLAE